MSSNLSANPSAWERAYHSHVGKTIEELRAEVDALRMLLGLRPKYVTLEERQRERERERTRR